MENANVKNYVANFLKVRNVYINVSKKNRIPVVKFTPKRSSEPVTDEEDEL